MSIFQYLIKKYKFTASRLKHLALSFYKKRFKFNKNKNVVKKNSQNYFLPVVEEYIEPAKKTKISVVVPTKNGGKDLYFLLTMIKKQRGFNDIEIIVVDSGSTDNTLDICHKMNATVVQISPEEFSHSYARNEGAKMASGDYILFTVQDALPTDENWLLECFCKLQSTNCIAVSCVEFMKEDADLFYTISSWNHNMFMEVSDSDRILSKPKTESYLNLRKNAQISNIACLIKRKIFLDYQFRYDYAEDLDLGIRLIRDNYKMLLLSSNAVIHSHNRSIYYHLKRGYVDGFYIPQMFAEQKIMQNYDFETLLSDFTEGFAFLNYLITKRFPQLSLPCNLQFLSQEIEKMFSNEDKTIVFEKIKPEYDNIDVQLINFVNKFQDFPDQKSKKFAPSNNILLTATKGFLNHIVFEYLKRTHPIIDSYLLEKLTLCIYKVYAFQSGVHLGVSYLQSSDYIKDNYENFHQELIKNI